MKEYVNKFRKFIYWPLKTTGFLRFVIINEQIVQLTRMSLLYNTFILIVANGSVCFLVYSSMFMGNYLKIPDGLCILHFALFANVILINLTFINRHSGLKLINNCIKIDCYLGAKETAFLRKIAIRTFITLHCLVTFTNVSGGVFLFLVYKVSIAIHVVGSLYFFWLFFVYDDYCFGLFHFTFISLRVRYLNVALLKIGNINEDYLPKSSLFNLIFWNKKFNKLVNFQTQAGIEEFNKVFRMLFNMLRDLERFYRFPILCGVWTIVMGSFVAVQTFIIRVKNSSAMDTRHTFIIVGWVILSWGFMMLMTILTDIFQQQIKETKLVCSYILLKPNKPAEIYKLAKTVLRTLEMRIPVISIYGLFNFETGFVFRIAASTLVYITVQLQLAFPKLPLNYVRLNETIVT